jgi:inactivated superfamily I helicase
MSKIILTEKQVNELFNKLQEEEVDLDNYEAPFSSDDFINWVNSEYDLDLLQIVSSKIQERINFLETIISAATRKKIKGFRP